MVLGGLVLTAEARRERAKGGPAEPLSAEEQARLQRMVQEETLARLVYQQMFEVHNARVFGNIARSEARHAQQVAQKFAKYGVTDPLADHSGSSGDIVFADADLKKLYASLTDPNGPAMNSCTEALRAGALIEEMDILDLETALSETTHADLARMYSNLLNASRNHLRAFVWQLEAAGEDYTPQQLSVESFNAIVN
jgi:hypothetical protein